MMCYTSIATTIRGYKNNLPGNVIASQLIQNGYVLTWTCIGAVAVSKIPQAVFAKLGKGLGYLLGEAIGAIGNVAIPVVAQLLGTLIGSVIGGLSYKWLYGLSISLCVEKGYTFFGLVKQDYAIPEPLHKFLISDCINLKKEVI